MIAPRKSIHLSVTPIPYYAYSFLRHQIANPISLVNVSSALFCGVRILERAALSHVFTRVAFPLFDPAIQLKRLDIQFRRKSKISSTPLHFSSAFSTDEQFCHGAVKFAWSTRECRTLNVIT
ncbi:hypothetical protein AVEN_268711-1 [Araneus ventricosus]|uniref:Uncharacterized protein n=1 Tax=Araneus ventricosus TaxID=182803 RepID=A0A4Y2PM41_ARAVE|nr:hypothetical protein AVEN_268711-1 [Araneus ventricosus]